MTGVLVVGDVALDVVAVPSGPITPRSDTRSQNRTAPGGTAGNVAVWLAHLGTPVTLVTCVGDDAAGRFVSDALVGAGVTLRAATVPSPTGCVIVIVDADGARTMLPDRGANAGLEAAQVTSELLATHDHLHLSGYVLLDPQTREVGTEILTAARTAGLRTSVDPQAAALVAADRDGIVAALQGVDVLLPNDDELAALAGPGPAGRTPAPTDLASSLLDDVGAVAVTHGRGGATWVSPEATHHVPATKVRVVDDIGCGDAFDAGLLAALSSGADPRSALEAGVAAGSRAAETPGPWPPPLG